ncbi:hypothetical protein MYAM1_002763 [Malassezia yamatoensis]|uniref:Amidohydrolase-related domain-containing protein n=1 Tax=Malassezia yamatoensis TaxID=253288 RepID=A0AAJ6CJQ1_9BASI|nr:hypothetical protein MYAM1_002763 [Malassezia yamatoensis]
MYPDDFNEESVMERLKDFYYDIALSSTEVPMVALTSFARQNHVVFGSDFPYAPESIALSFAQRFDAITKLTDGQHSAINNGNAKALVKDTSGKL